MTTLGRPRDRHKEQFWRQTLQRFERSGLSATQFCRVHKLPRHSFWAWKRTLQRRDHSAPSNQPAVPAPVPHSPSPAQLPFFLPLRLPHADSLTPPGVAGLLEVLLPNGLRLRLPQQFDPDTLQRLLTLLRGVSC